MRYAKFFSVLCDILRGHPSALRLTVYRFNLQSSTITYNNISDIAAVNHYYGDTAPPNTEKFA